MAFQLVSNFPNRLKEALCETQITDFANKIGLSKQAISAYTLGTRKPKAPTISVIANSLNVSEAWLMGYNVPKERNELFISAKDIPDFLKKSLTDEESVLGLLSMFLSSDEMDVLLKYKKLDDRGREAVITTLNREFKYTENVRPLEEQTDDDVYILPVAARSGEQVNIKTTKAKIEADIANLKPSDEEDL